MQSRPKDRTPEPHQSVLQAIVAPRLVVENVTPATDAGQFAVKRVVGDHIRAEVDAYGEGHDPICVMLRIRHEDGAWHETPMRPIGNDRWAADFRLDQIGRYRMTVEAWRSAFAIYRDHLAKKADARLALPVDIAEGRRLVARLAETAPGAGGAQLQEIAAGLETLDDTAALERLLDEETRRAAEQADPREFATGPQREIIIESERTRAGFASWYELFPRSQSNDPNRHGTFDDVIARLPAIEAMGFDVLYMPPIHPIGTTNRKGRNNALVAGPDDPGSPYAIGSAEGGHDAVHPELGGLEAFQRMRRAAEERGIEIALDFAIQCSPDHPWLAQHPEWFDWLPDGTIRFAENPPKKYEDIVNVDFYADGAKPELWLALRDVILFWVEQGVKLFRVDNPHTKPFPFWEWLIADIRREHFEVVFLAEAFANTKIAYRLARIGFGQSYTFFTWRETKGELTQYFEELTQGPPRDFFRPHLFVNTPDINPDYLQNAPRPMFLIRAALAATLSGLWGMYNGFELCEGRPDAKRKEYADSEKYQIVAWDWDRPGNIIAEITALNRIRRENPALQSHLGLQFHNAWNDRVLYFEKATADRSNVVLVAISLDPHEPQECEAEIPLWNFGLPDHAAIAVEDLMRGHRFTWHGKIQRLRFDPAKLPFSIWRLSLGEGA